MESDKKGQTTTIKVVLVGQSGVGKTCIINRFISSEFNSENPPTSGSSFASKTMYFDKYDANIKFDIWDTAGQEAFKSVAKIFYKDAKIAILVYDICRKQSFDEITNYWYKQIRDNSPKDISKK